MAQSINDGQSPPLKSSWITVYIGLRYRLFSEAVQVQLMHLPCHLHSLSSALVTLHNSQRCVLLRNFTPMPVGLPFDYAGTLYLSWHSRQVNSVNRTRSPAVHQNPHLDLEASQCLRHSGLF